MPSGHVARHAVQLLLADERSEIGPVVDAGADAQRPGVAGDVFEDAIVRRLFDEDPRSGRAHLSLVVEDRRRSGARRALHVGVGQDDVRRLATELQRQLLQVARRGANEDPADLRRTGERHLVHAVVGGEGRARGLAKAGHEVDDARGNARLLAQLDEADGAERRLFSGLEHDRATGGKRRRQLPRRHLKREVPRRDLTAHADRLPARVRQVALRARPRLRRGSVRPPTRVAQPLM